MQCKESAPWCSGHVSNALWFVGQWLLWCTADRGTVTVILSLQKGLQDVMSWRAPPLQKGVLLVGTALWPGTKYCQHVVVTP